MRCQTVNKLYQTNYSRRSADQNRTIKRSATRRQSGWLKKSRRSKRQRKNVTTADFDIPSQEPTTSKMKLPLLVLSLVLIYWACIIYAEKDVNSTRDVTNSDEYTSNYQYVPLGTSLSRHKRSIMSPLLSVIMNIFGKSAGLMLKPVFDAFNLVQNILTGEIQCPKVEKLSLELVPKLMLNPIETIQTILCYILNEIGSQGRVLARKGFEMGLEFTKRTLIPGLYTFLNFLKNTNLLPPPIVAMIEAFNVVYKILKMLGYVG